MYLLSLKCERLEILEEELINNKENKKIKETPEERVLRRKNEKRNIKKNS